MIEVQSDNRSNTGEQKEKILSRTFDESTKRCSTESNPNQKIDLNWNTIPSRVRGLKTTKYTADNLTLAWEAVYGAKSYEVHLDKPGEETEILSTEETTIKLTSLCPGKIYFVRIAGINEAGRGTLSEQIEILTVPSAPQNIQAKHLQTSPHNSILVTFKDANQGSKKHIVYARPLGANKEPTQVETLSQQAVLRSLRPGESYEISVATQQVNLTSEKTVSKSPIQMYPCKPTGVTAVVQNKELRIQWNHLEIPPLNYMVEMRVNEYVIKEHTENNFLTKHDLLLSSVYRISVAAKNEAGIGQMSDSVKVATDPAPPEHPWVCANPFAPATSLTIGFEDLDTAKKSYRITASSVDNDGQIEMTTTQKRATIHGLKPDHVYAVDVISVMGDKTSEPVRCVPTKAQRPRSPVAEFSSDEGKSSLSDIQSISYAIVGGEFQGAIFGPQMNKRVYKAPDYTNATINIHHHYYDGTNGGKAGSGRTTTTDSYYSKLLSYFSRVLNTLPREKIKELVDELQETFEIYSPADLLEVELEELELSLGPNTLKSAQKRKFLHHVEALQNQFRDCYK